MQYDETYHDFSYLKNESSYPMASFSPIDELFHGEAEKLYRFTKPLEVFVSLRGLPSYHQNPQRRKLMNLCGWSIERDLDTTIIK